MLGWLTSFTCFRRVAVARIQNSAAVQIASLQPKVQKGLDVDVQHPNLAAALMEYQRLRVKTSKDVIQQFQKLLKLQVWAQILANQCLE